MKARCFKEAKTVKTGTEFIFRDTAQCVGDLTGKQFVYPTQKQGRDVHPEKKGMGILSRNEECSKSKLGRDRHWEKNAGVLGAEQRGMEAM